MATVPLELRNYRAEKHHLFPPCWVLAVQAAEVVADKLVPEEVGAPAEGAGRGAGGRWEGQGRAGEETALASPLSMANPSTCALGPILIFFTSSCSAFSPYPFLASSFTTGFPPQSANMISSPLS